MENRDSSGRREGAARFFWGEDGHGHGNAAPYAGGVGPSTVLSQGKAAQSATH
jgi:hypothetical protein